MLSLVKETDSYGDFEVFRKGGAKFFSFLISAYNAEKFIRGCLESIIKQDNSDYELVILDDGSTDKTLNVIISMISKFDNIVLIKQSNMGLTKSLNRGIKHARGEWVVRCDADDVNKFTRISQLSSGIENGINFYTAYAELINGEGSKSIVPRSLYFKKGKVELRSLVFGNPYVHGTLLAKRDVLCSYMYDDTLKYSQDYELLVRLLRSGETVKCLDGIHYEFHRRDESIGNRYSVQQADCARQALVKNGISPRFQLVSRKSRVVRFFIFIFREIFLKT